MRMLRFVLPLLDLVLDLLDLFLHLLDHSIFWIILGSLSYVGGLLCYALSSSFKSLFGERDPTKIVLYIIVSSIIPVLVFLASKCPESVVKFLVLMLSSLYSFFADRSKEGKPDTWSVVSSVAFALTSLSLSRLIKPGFDVGLLGFFLGCVTGQLMKIHLIFILVAAVICYPLAFLASYSVLQSQQFLRGLRERMRLLEQEDQLERGLLPRRQEQQHQEEPPPPLQHREQPPQPENGDSSAEELEGILIDNANGESFGMGQDKAGQITHRRHVGNVSPSPSPQPSTRLTQDDDRSANEGGSSSNDPLLARLPANKSFENLPKWSWRLMQQRRQPLLQL